MLKQTLAAGVLAVAGLATTASAAPSDNLWTAMTRVESGGDARAYNRREKAAGIVQIRPTCLADVNRIARLRGLSERFALADRYNVAKSRRIWALYLDHYGDAYRRTTGRDPTDQVFARIWNGGPKGYAKRATLKYWRRIVNALP